MRGTPQRRRHRPHSSVSAATSAAETFAAVTALLAGVAFVASWLPALRASRLDPAGTLQAD
jgi:ABC-type lipoprotein release transport system permease subunit